MSRITRSTRETASTPVWDQGGDGKEHRRICPTCGRYVRVIGARIGRKYFCPACECKQDRDAR